MKPPSPHLRSPILACVVFLASCAHTHAPDRWGRIAPIKSYRLLAAVGERPTERFPQPRKDLEVNSHADDRVPHVVATGQSPVVRREGARVRLYGDPAGTQPWSVDNAILLEVYTESGERYDTAVVGYLDALWLDHNQVDNVGRMSLTFEPGEVDITGKVPEDEPFYVRATALDNGGVAKVSDVYLVLEQLVKWSGNGSELREQ